ASWTLSSLTITPANDTNFTLSIAAAENVAEGNISAATTATEPVTVNPLAPTVSPAAETGVEGQAIALNLGVTVNHLPGTNGDARSEEGRAGKEGRTRSDGPG